MNAQQIVLWIWLLSAGPLFGQFESTQGAIPTNAVVRLEFGKTEFLVGENIFANYAISNTGGAEFSASVGGDYRGGSRASRFKVTAQRDDGKVARDPEPVQWNMGGLSPWAKLRSHSNWFEHVWIARYCELTEPGNYTITVFHDLGWGKKNPIDPREVSARIRLRLPTEKEARELVHSTLSSPKDGGWTWGERGAQLTDVGVLRHPVYLPALVEHAGRGSAEAMRGIASVRTVEGTEALTKFLRAKRGEPISTNSLQAARLIDERLPKPPPKWKMEGADEKRAMLEATWHPKFAPSVREFATVLLSTTNRDALLLAASELGAVGQSEDFDPLKSAVDRAATLTDTVWTNDHGYPYHQSVARSLAETAFKLGATNHDFSYPRTAGDALLFLGYLRDTNSVRPKNWEETALKLLRDRSSFIRAETAWVVPKPPTGSIREELVRLMTDPDVAVRNWALEAVQGTRSPAIRSNVLRILSSTTDRSLLNAAVRLVITNGARAEAAEILAARFNDALDGPGSAMPHEAMMALVTIVSGGGHVSGGFNQGNDFDALRSRWIDFVARHKEELAAGKNFKPGDGSGFAELIAAGWEFYPPKP